MTVSRPSPVDVATSQVDTLDWNLPGTLVWGQQAKHFQMAFKRVLDFSVAAVGLLFLAVPFLLIAIAIKLDSRGPVFYPHIRVGHHGRHFRMFKFRSMVVDAALAKEGLLPESEADAPLFKIKHDPRRTRVGQFLRRFSIDELPQLINVLQGHMSLVGPRPALPEEASLYNDFDAHRVIAVPGITGLWQVNGRSLLSFEEMVRLDVAYARDWSLWLDIAILARTIPVVLSGRGAY